MEKCTLERSKKEKRERGEEQKEEKIKKEERERRKKKRDVIKTDRSECKGNYLHKLRENETCSLIRLSIPLSLRDGHTLSTLSSSSFSFLLPSLSFSSFFSSSISFFFLFLPSRCISFPLCDSSSLPHLNSVHMKPSRGFHFLPSQPSSKVTRDQIVSNDTVLKVLHVCHLGGILSSGETEGWKYCVTGNKIT